MLQMHGAQGSRRVVFGLWAACAVALCGCPTGNPPPEPVGNAASRLAGVKIRVAIVDDAELAQSVRLRAGDWQAQTGSTIEILEKTNADVLNEKYREADAIVYPAYLLGPLAEMDAIRPVSPVLLSDTKLNWRDVFDAVRLHETMWARQVYAMPLGSPVLTCYCRADLLAHHQRQPPPTWQEYQELAELLSQRSHPLDEGTESETTWYATVEPLAPAWAGITLLARAAAYAKHPDHYSTLFDIETMEPRIAAAPFVRALEELAAAARLGPPDARELNPMDVRRMFHRGQCGMALSWPSAAGATDDQPASVPWVLAELPGSRETFDPRARQWTQVEAPDVRRVPLLSIAGRLGSATSTSDHAEAALEFLTWLISSQWNWGADVAASSADTTMFRRIHAADPRPWIEPTGDGVSLSAAADTIQRSLDRRQSIDALRIAGRDRYIAALDEAVYRVLDGLQSPTESLEAAAERWRSITEELGIDAQRRAYRRSLELVE